MDVTTIQELYRYNRWANARVFEAVGALPTEEFVRAVPSSFPSIRETLTHIVWAEWIWLQRWKGNSPTTMFSPSESPDASALRARWTEVEAEQTEFVRSLTNDRLHEVVRYVNLQGQPWAYALWKQMLHFVNHSTYHRGQITTMLRQLGARPSPTDLLVFYDQGGQQQECLATAPAEARPVGASPLNAVLDRQQGRPGPECIERDRAAGMK